MRHLPTNPLLLLLLLGQALSGVLGLLNDLEQRAWVLWWHSAGAIALLLLLGPKALGIWRAWRRGERWTAARTGALTLLLLLLATLGLGMGWSWAGPLYWGGFSWLTLHIFLSVPLLILLLWHARRMRPQWRQPERDGRRAFLHTAGMAAAALLLTPLARFGQRARRFTGSYETGSYTGRFPSVSWIADDPSPVDSAKWRLQVTGVVAQAVNLSFEEMRAMSDVSREATLDCTGGWYTDQMWQGVSLSVLLAAAGPLPAAQSVTVRSVTGYERRFSLEEASGALLAMAVAGVPLSHGHGFPLRLVVPERRGFHWVKWVEAIEVNETPAAWQPPVPLS